MRRECVKFDLGGLRRMIIYLTGLLCTCFGVAIVLKTGWGLDAWNGVFAGLEKLTPLTIGLWSVIIQGCFWGLASALNRKAEWLCVLPILFKGIFLDIARKAVSLAVVPSGRMTDCALFLLGYVLVVAGTGIYVATGYPKMPIDGLMLAVSDFFSWSVKKARFTIELSGFVLLLLTHGPFGGGTIIITFTMGCAVAESYKLARKWLFSDPGSKICMD